MFRNSANPAALDRLASRTAVAPKGTALSLALLLAAALTAGLTITGCASPTDTADKDSPGSAANSPSSAFFAIPDSLTGSSDGISGSWSPSRATRAREVSSSITVSDSVDTQIGNTVESYFAMVRDQVRFAAEVADSVKDLIVELESVKFGETYLLDWPTDLTEQNGSDGIYSWTIVTAGSEWKLEKWELGETVSNSTKEFELSFEKSGTAYAGTVILNGDYAFSRDETAATVMPAMMQIDFDSGIAVPGTASLTLSLQEFRSIGDIYDSTGTVDDLENAIIVLSKNLSTGEVSIASSILVPNSRHFVWDGYDSDGTVNLASDPAETRFYAARGMSSGTAADLAAVELGLPETYTSATDAFSDTNALGPMIAQLMTERLNNNYDFGSGEMGQTILSNLSQVPGITLDTTTWNNTSADIISALGTVQQYLEATDPTDANYASNQESLDNVSFLLGVMSVVNPVYFASSDYTGYETALAADSADYPDLADISLSMPGEDAVTALSISFTQ